MLALRDDDAIVFAAYACWRKANPVRGVEEWLASLYELRQHPRQLYIQGATWSKAIRCALRRLVDIPLGRNTPYYFGISTYRCHAVHEQFWDRVESDFDAKIIVSMNYDLLVEQALHSNKSQHPVFTQMLLRRIHAHPGRSEDDGRRKEGVRLVQLGNEFALYKTSMALSTGHGRNILRR